MDKKNQSKLSSLSCCGRRNNGFSNQKWYKEKLFLVISGLIFIQIIHFVLDYFKINILHDLIIAFYDYVKIVWLPISIGLLFGGFIDRFIPQEYIMKYLSQHKKRTIFYSVGLGFLTSACSHGILALAIELYKKGASIPAVISFLLASPWANLPVTLLLFGFFGLKAFLYLFSALLIAIITGFCYQLLERKGLIEAKKDNGKILEDFSILGDIKQRWRRYKFTLQSIRSDIKGVLKGSWELAKMTIWWILIGMFLASVARAYLPHEVFVKYIGPTFLGLIITLGIATILEICSEGTAPLAFEIFKQTGAFGNSFVFLMAGVATDYTEIGLIWTNIGKKTAIWLPLITVPQILTLGLVFNFIF